MTSVPAVNWDTNYSRTRRESWKHVLVESSCSLKDKHETYQYSDELVMPNIGHVQGGSIGTSLDLRDVPSASWGRLASDMYRHMVVSPIALPDRTETDLSGWKSLLDIDVSTTGELRSKIERFRKCVAYLDDNVRERDDWLLNRLLQPPLQVLGSSATKWRIRLNSATSSSDITTTLGLCGLGETASDIREVEALASEDPENMPMDLVSLRHAAVFLLSERRFPSPLITVTPVGYLWLEWQISPSGILAMNFLPSGRIQFAAISEPPRRSVETESVEGTMRKEDMLAAIRPFISRLQPR